MMRTAFVIALLVSTCSAYRSIAENLPTWSPNRPVRIVVPFQAGGPIDTIARIVAQQLNEKWGQSFIIENRTGGGGNILNRGVWQQTNSVDRGQIVRTHGKADDLTPRCVAPCGAITAAVSFEQQNDILGRGDAIRVREGLR